MCTKKRVVLFSSIDAEGFAQLPLSVLAVGTVLEKQGYKVEVVDVQTDSNWEKTILKLCKNALFFGVSAMTGTSIDNSLRSIELVKSFYPDLPIVFGGYHASSAGPKLLEECNTDYVIVGPGEKAIVSLAKYIEGGEQQKIEDIPNLFYKNNGEIIKNKFEIIEDMDESVPPMNYDLVDVFKYYYTNTISRTQKRFYYCSSYGCAGNCTFCSERNHTHLSWRGLSAERIVKDLKRITIAYTPERIQFVDPCFTTDINRVCEFVKLMNKENWRTNLMFDARISDLLKLDKKISFNELHEIGVEKIYTGIESGSDRMLKKLNKTFSSQDAFNMCKALNDARIIAHLSFVHDFPDETEEDSNETLKLCERLCELENIRQLHRFFVPFEGTILYEDLEKKGLIIPKSQKEWANTCIDGSSSVWKGRKKIRQNVLESINLLREKHPIAFKYQHELVINE